MAEPQDEWDKVREMVRNAPPPISEAPPPPLATEEPAKTGGNKLVWIVLALIVIGGIGYAAVEYGPTLTGMISPKEEESIAAKSPPPAEVKTAPKPPPPPQILTIRRDVKTATVRAGPAANEAVVTRLRGGDRVEKVSEKSGWVEIRTNRDGKTVEGWISGKVLE